MTRYMPKVGRRGLDMMYRTCTVQANLDFASEADMVAKLRVGLALQPMITALFANSPFTEGKPNGLMSARSEIWRDTDPDRTGMLPFAFEEGMGYERYVDYALDVPMYFVKRGEVYHDVAGASFRDLMAGKLKGLKRERATCRDWANHLSTIFPEVRLKRYLEMRGADVGSRDRIVALAAMMVGLFYDKAALAGAGELIKGWSAEQRQKLREEVPRLGLPAVIAGARPRCRPRRTGPRARGLKRRGRLDARGQRRATISRPLEQIVENGARRRRNGWRVTRSRGSERSAGFHGSRDLSAEIASPSEVPGLIAPVRAVSTETPRDRTQRRARRAARDSATRPCRRESPKAPAVLAKARGRPAEGRRRRKSPRRRHNR